MGDVITEVNDTLTAISKVMEGAAKKEEQMKDGPPESQEPKPEGGTKTAYDKFKEDSAKAWSNYDKHGDKIPTRA